MGKRQKVHANRGVQMWFANFPVNQPCFRLDCRESYRFFRLSAFQKTREGCGCPKFVAGKVLRQISTLLENYCPIFRQREMLCLPRFGHFPARKMAAGKSAPPSGTLLDFLLRDRHATAFLSSPEHSGIHFREPKSAFVCVCKHRALFHG